MSGNNFRADFAKHGFARLDRAFADSVDGMADAVWAELRRRHGILRSQRSTWTLAEPRGLGALRKRGVFEPLATPAVRAVISELLGHTNWPHPFSWGDPLVTFPTPASGPCQCLVGTSTFRPGPLCC